MEYLIHGLKNWHYIPLIFSLLPNKLTSTYEYLFRVLISKFATFNFDFNLKIVVVDFEKAIHLIKIYYNLIFCLSLFPYEEVEMCF
jgi:hypothetical protein